MVVVVLIASLPTCFMIGIRMIAVLFNIILRSRSHGEVMEWGHCHTEIVFIKSVALLFTLALSFIHTHLRRRWLPLQRHTSDTIHVGLEKIS